MRSPRFNSCRKASFSVALVHWMATPISCRASRVHTLATTTAICWSRRAAHAHAPLRHWRARAASPVVRPCRHSLKNEPAERLRECSAWIKALHLLHAAATGTDAATRRLRLNVNGQAHEIEIDSRTSLLDLLREHLGLTGAKKGCDHGQCGACTVHLDGRRVVSCLTLALQANGRTVTTIEGLTGARRRAASDAAGIHRSRCAAMRLLHTRTDHGGSGVRSRGPRIDGAADPRVHEREHLPLRCLRVDRRRDPGRRER